MKTAQIYSVYTGIGGAGIVQSVQRLAMGWTAEGSEFEFR
jgi:hypothetical protein